MYLIVLLSLLIGIVAGCTSVGGVLIIPAIEALTEYPMRTIMATALVSFLVPSMVGTLLHARLRNFTLRSVVPLCIGGAVACLVGTMIQAYIPLAILKGVLGVIISLSGLTALRPVSSTRQDYSTRPQRQQDMTLLFLGTLIGLSSGTTGAGGAVLSVPIMMIIGQSPITAIAAAQPFQVILSIAGGLGSGLTGGVDWWLWLWLTIPMLAGIFLGIRALRVINPSFLRIGVGLLCLGTGLYMVANEFLAF